MGVGASFRMLLGSLASPELRICRPGLVLCVLFHYSRDEAGRWAASHVLAAFTNLRAQKEFYIFIRLNLK